MLRREWRLAVIALQLLAVSWPVKAQGVIAPEEIVIHLSREVGDRRFVKPLAQRLACLLRPPARFVPAAFDVRPFVPAQGQVDAEKLFPGFAGSLGAQGDVMHVLVITQDMRLTPYRYVFSASGGGPEPKLRILVVSLARLQDKVGHDTDPEATAARMGKLIAKNTARLSGYAAGNACVLSFPNNLGELDALHADFCARDRAVLEAAGVAGGEDCRPPVAGISPGITRLAGLGP